MDAKNPYHVEEVAKEGLTAMRQGSDHALWTAFVLIHAGKRFAATDYALLEDASEAPGGELARLNSERAKVERELESADAAILTTRARLDELESTPALDADADDAALYAAHVGRERATLLRAQLEKQERERDGLRAQRDNLKHAAHPLWLAYYRERQGLEQPEADELPAGWRALAAARLVALVGRERERIARGGEARERGTLPSMMHNTHPLMRLLPQYEREAAAAEAEKMTHHADASGIIRRMGFR